MYNVKILILKFTVSLSQTTVLIIKISIVCKLNPLDSTIINSLRIMII